MDLPKFAEKLMVMSDASWQKHANPWSVYTRFSILPLISLAFWSREWIGMYSLFPILLSIFWIWLNPRCFSVPKNTDNWASMGTFGERIYLNRKIRPIPVHHVLPARILQILAACGLPILVFGLHQLNIWAVILGNIWVMAFKAWFVDRMVWLFMDFREADSTHRS